MNLELNTLPILYTSNVALSYSLFDEEQNCIWKY